MKHFIIVKFKEGYNYKYEIDNIKNLFEKSLFIQDVKEVIIYTSNSTKSNRYDLMIEMILTEKGLENFDSSEVHKQWKEIYSNYIENKTIFDCE